jgi:predicted RNase H-like nuclease
VRALGLDACRAGWMAVLFVDGRISGQRVFETFVAAVTEMQPDQVAIDIPIGLVNEADRWADVAARRYLKGNKSSVFNAPPRAVLEEYLSNRHLSVADARRISEKQIKKGLTSQTFGILKKIAEVHEARAQLEMPVFEVHPEVSFQALQPEWALPRKKSWDGLVVRTRLLEGLQVGFSFDPVGDSGKIGDADDFLDATVAGFTAAQPQEALTALDGSVETLNQRPQSDPDFGVIAIWLAERNTHDEPKTTDRSD